MKHKVAYNCKHYIYCGHVVGLQKRAMQEKHQGNNVRKVSVGMGPQEEDGWREGATDRGQWRERLLTGGSGGRDC